MRIAAVVLMLTALVAPAYWWPQRDPLPEFPRVMLWAWERPEKLDFINSRETGWRFWRAQYICAGEWWRRYLRASRSLTTPHTDLSWSRKTEI